MQRSLNVQRFPSSGHGVKSGAVSGVEHTPVAGSHVETSHTAAGQTIPRSTGQVAWIPSQTSATSHEFAMGRQVVPAGTRFGRQVPLRQVSGRSHAALAGFPHAAPFVTLDHAVVLDEGRHAWQAFAGLSAPEA